MKGYLVSANELSQNKNLSSYHGNPFIKEEFVALIHAHRQADCLVQGTYTEEGGTQFRGCAIGCSIHSMGIMRGEHFQHGSFSDHRLFESELGIPMWIAHIEDHIFESLWWEDAREWPLALSEAIPVGVNLEPIHWSFSLLLVNDVSALLEKYIPESAVLPLLAMARLALAKKEQGDQNWGDLVEVHELSDGFPTDGNTIAYYGKRVAEAVSRSDSRATADALSVAIDAAVFARINDDPLTLRVRDGDVSDIYRGLYKAYAAKLLDLLRLSKITIVTEPARDLVPA